MHKKHLMPASSGTLVQAKRWHVAGDEALMSEREARITVTGLYNQADVLCIKTCSCLHAAVRRYKQMLVRCRGWTPDVQKGSTHHTGRAKQSTRRAEHKNLLMPARSGTPVQAKCCYAPMDEPLMSKREARITLTGPKQTHGPYGGHSLPRCPAGRGVPRGFGALTGGVRG